MKSNNKAIKAFFWILALPVFFITLLLGKPEDAFLLMKDTGKNEDSMSPEAINKIL